MFSCDNNEGLKIKIQKEIANYDIWKNSDYCRNDSAILLNFSDGSNLFLYPKDKKSIKIKTLKTGQSDWSVREKTKEPFIYKLFTRSEEHRVGKECTSGCRARGGQRLEYTY